MKRKSLLFIISLLLLLILPLTTRAEENTKFYFGVLEIEVILLLQEIKVMIYQMEILNLN